MWATDCVDRMPWLKYAEKLPRRGVRFTLFVSSSRLFGASFKLPGAPIRGTIRYRYWPPGFAVRSRQLNFCTGHSSVVLAVQLRLSPPTNPTQAGKVVSLLALMSWRWILNPRHCEIALSYVHAMKTTSFVAKATALFIHSPYASLDAHEVELHSHRGSRTP